MYGQESESPTEADGVARDDQRGMANLVKDDVGLAGLGSYRIGRYILKERYFASEEFLAHKNGIGSFVAEHNELARYISEIRSRGSSELGTSSSVVPEHQSLELPPGSELANYQAPNVHNCSLQVVRNASGDPLKYVMKYFNIKADQTNLADVENLGDSITRLENAVYNLQQREVSITKSVNPPASSWSITRTSSCNTSDSSYRRPPFHTPCTSLNT